MQSSHACPHEEGRSRPHVRSARASRQNQVALCADTRIQRERSRAFSGIDTSELDDRRALTCGDPESAALLCESSRQAALS
jgi:hypothetical protein